MLAGHVQKGKRQFVPPIVHSGVFNQVDWRRTDLPDLIWPILVSHLNGNDAIRGFVNWQKELIATLKLNNQSKGLVECLDGRLSGIEILAQGSIKRQGIIREAAIKHGLLPDRLQQILLTYPSFPGRWIFKAEAPEETQKTDLFDAVIAVLGDGHREALIKCISIWAALQGGTFSADKTFLDALVDYPTNIKNQKHADSLVRASWTPRQKYIEKQLPSRENLTKQWSQDFWRINSKLLPCFRHQDFTQHKFYENNSSTTSKENAVDENIGRDSRLKVNRYQSVLDRIEKFIETLEISGFEQHSREKYEVNSGLIVRAGRELLAVLEAPVLWTSEFGSHITRMLVETQIYLTWMAKQDDHIYRQFQEYGFGKSKLYEHMLKETSVEHLTDEIRKGIDEFNRLSRNSEVLDIRTIDTRDSFAGGKSIRAMAAESGHKELYTMVYGVASGVTHSEWWSIEQNAMEECLNVLHGGHLIPSLSLNSGGDERLADHWIGMYNTMMDEVIEILGLEWELDFSTGPTSSSSPEPRTDSGDTKTSG